MKEEAQQVETQQVILETQQVILEARQTIAEAKRIIEDLAVVRDEAREAIEVYDGSVNYLSDELEMSGYSEEYVGEIWDGQDD